MALMFFIIRAVMARSKSMMLLSQVVILISLAVFSIQALARLKYWAVMVISVLPTIRILKWLLTELITQVVVLENSLLKILRLAVWLIRLSLFIPWMKMVFLKMAVLPAQTLLHRVIISPKMVCVISMKLMKQRVPITMIETLKVHG